VQDQDLTLGLAMTDAEGGCSRRPHQQTNPDRYLRVVEPHALQNGVHRILISGAKAIARADG
jgi:4-hydroxybutyryl-CoA dehydratase/vinylacetyl-CoA-Delta-isomerase